MNRMNNDNNEQINPAGSESEEAVFGQELSADELNAATGGAALSSSCGKTQIMHCNLCEKREIYEGSFPNCAATVEDGSWCGTNDACVRTSVNYQGMNDCNKAWR